MLVDGSLTSETFVIPLSQRSGIVMEDGAEESEAGRMEARQSSGHDWTMALMNARQLWQPAQISPRSAVSTPGCSEKCSLSPRLTEELWTGDGF